jgi:CRP/FNR family transcriptional regulator, cyclic AMP receptor protein
MGGDGMAEPITRRRELLAQAPMFSTVPAAQLDELAAKATAVALSARETLFAKGDPGNRLYLVVKGMVRIGVLSAEGREVTYGLIGPGELFGEIAVLDGGVRSADATALEDCELLALERRDVLSFLEGHPNHMLHLVAVLCHRVRCADELLEDVVFLSLPSRLAKHLLVLAQAVGVRHRGKEAVTVRMSQQEIADHLGISRESVNKVLSKWEQVGIVALGRGQIVLSDRERLQEFATPT